MKKKAANRPRKYGEETVVMTTRVPKGKVNEVRKLVKNWLKKFEV